MRLDRERLQDIQDAIEAIERYAAAGAEVFERNELVRVWCLRHLELIGEAAGKLSEEIRSKAPSTPWRQMVGMRNALIHGYFDVNWKRVWSVIERDIAPLKQTVQELLAIVESSEDS